MWKILVCLMVLGLVCDGVQGGDGDVFLSGTIKLKGGGKCLQANGMSVAVATCVEVVVVETAAEGEFKIQTLAGTRTDNQLTLASGGNAFDNTGTTVVFNDGTNNLNTLAKLIDGDAPFLIRLSSESGATAACLKADGTYTAASGCTIEDDLWYFVQVTPCQGTDCATCNVDALLCETCAANKVRNTDKTACEACSVEIHAQCTACNENSGTKTCTACNAGYITDAAGCAQCPAGKRSNNNVCEACEKGQIVTNNACVACKDTETVTSNACVACAEGMTPNAARVACVDACSDSNCKFCDSGKDSCGECKDGYKVDSGKCEEENGENVASNTMPILSVLILAVITGRWMA